MKQDSLLDLSYQLCELPNRAAYIRSARDVINRLIPGDDAFWMECDFNGPTTRVWHGPRCIEDHQLGALLAAAEDHPGIQSYVARPTDLSPRRLSDVSARSTSSGTRTYEDYHRIVGRYQLSLAVRLVPPRQGEAWVIGRSSRDFTDNDVQTARQLLPLLTVLDRFHSRPEGISQTVAPAGGIHNSAHLTPRELDILMLVSRGLTANNIARLRRISSRTVQKHLEHIYAKLGCHHRMMAVERARQIGLLPPTST